MRLGEYKPGQIAFYHEDGGIDIVEILEKNSDLDWIKYRLKVVEVLQESPITKPSEIGHEFNLELKRDSTGIAGLLVGYLSDSI